MINRIYTTKNDTEAIQRTLYDANGIIDLTSATIKFRWGRRGSTTRTEETCTIVGAPTLGVVKFSWASPPDVGTYVGRFVVTIGSVITSVPNTPDQIIIIVSPD